MIRLKRRGLPLLLPLAVLMLTTAVPANTAVRPGPGMPVPPASPVAPRVRPRALPPRSFVPAPLRAALTTPRALPSMSHSRLPSRGFVPTLLRSQGGFARPAPPRRGAGGGLGAAAAIRLRRRIAALPLSFEANTGEVDRRVTYLAHGDGYTLYLTATGAVLALTRYGTKTAGDHVRAAGTTGTLGLRATAAMPLQESVVGLQFAGANRAPRVAALGRLRGQANYFIGRDRRRWRTGIRTYGRVRFADVYPGIDLVYYGTQGRLEYDWVLKPGADPRRIAYTVRGARSLTVNRRGDLVIQASAGALIQHLPTVYQVVRGHKRAVRGRYMLGRAGRVGFAVGAYDRTKPLTIDPVLSYGTYLGGSTGFSDSAGIALDAQRNAYVTGATSTTSFPTTPGAYSTSLANGAGVEDAFVAKFSPDGATLLYSTYLGGSGQDEGNSIAVDGDGNAYIAGDTQSANFPTTPTAYAGTLGGGTCLNGQKSRPCSDAFVAKISATQSGTNSLLYSTYLGGGADDVANGVAVDTVGGTGYAYVTGSTASANFPTGNAPRSAYGGGASDAFVTKLDTTASGAASLLYSTYLGGSGTDTGRGIATDNAGDVFVTGVVTSTDFQTTPNASQATYGGGATDAFVTTLDTTQAGAASLLYSSYFGGAGDDYGNAIATDGDGAAYVAGDTTSANLPTTANAAARTYGGGACADTRTGAVTRSCTDAFVAAVDTVGGLLQYGTYLGGGADDRAYGIALDEAGNMYVTGETNSGNFPTANALQGYGGGACSGMTDAGGTYTYPCPDAFVTELGTLGTGAAATGGGLTYSTYLGGSADDDALGIAVDGAGAAYVTGGTFSSNFPTTASAYASTTPMSGTAYLAKIGYASGPRPHLAGDSRVPSACPCHGVSGGPGPFDARSGGLWTTAPSLTDGQSGPALAWAPTYSAQAVDIVDGPMGHGWQEPFATRLRTAGGVAVVTTSDGNEERFQALGNGQFAPYAGVFSTLVRAGATYTETLQSGDQAVFDATGRATMLQDAHGRRLQLQYTGRQLTGVVDTASAGRTFTLGYTNGYLTSVTAGDGRAMSYGYDYVNGDLTAITDTMGNVTTYHYQNHLLVEIDDALGEPVERTQYDTYTPSGRVISQTLQDGEQYTVSYAAAMTAITDTGRDGNAANEQVLYDPTLNVMTAMYRNGTRTESEQADANFNPVASTDANSNTTYTAYNAAGLPISTTDALGETSLAGYNASNQPVTSTDALGRQTVSLYDARNNLISQTVGITTAFPQGYTTLFTYTTGYSNGVPDAGQQWLQARQGPDGVVTHYDYNTVGQVMTATAGYGAAGGPRQITTYGYDPMGHAVTTTIGAGTAQARTDLTVYNNDGTVAQTTQGYAAVPDPARHDQNVTMSYGYDALGRQTWTQDPAGRYSVTHYNGGGQQDWTLRDATGASGAPALPATAAPPAYTAARPDANVATFYGYDGLGRQVLVTQTGILTGGVTMANGAPVFGAAATRVTRTGYDALSRPVTTTLNYRPDVTAPLSDTNIQTVRAYDAQGNLTGQRDALNRWTVTGYDPLNRPVTTTLNYEDGNPLTVAPQDQSWTDGHDSDIVSVVRYRPDGTVDRRIDNYVTGQFAASAPITDRVTQYQYDAEGHPITSTLDADPNTPNSLNGLNRAGATAYDPASGRALGQQDALGRWTATQYDALGRPATTIQNCADGQGNAQNPARQPASNPCGPTGPDRNAATTTGYDALGRIADTVDPLGHDTHTAYDALGRAVAVTQGYSPSVPAGARPDLNVTTATRYDALGRTIVTTDAAGSATTYGYDNLGRTVAVTDAMGRVTRTGYDGTGATRWSQGPDGRLTLYGVDGLGRTVVVTQNYTTTAGLAGAGAAGMNLATQTVYDPAGRAVQTIDALGRATTISYDLRDHLTMQAQNAQPACAAGATDCNVTTQYSYDRAGDQTRALDALGNATAYGYDAAGEQTVVTDTLGMTTGTTYDALGRAITATDALGRQTVAGYDGLGNLVTQTTGITAAYPLGLTTVYTYYLGQPQGQQGPDGVPTRDGYDALGRVVTTTVGVPALGPTGAMTTTYGYDAAGRVVTTTTGVGSATPRADLTLYNGDGTITATVQNAAPAGQSCAVAPCNVTTDYGYDAAGRQDAVRDPLGRYAVTHYNAAGQVDYTLRNLVPLTFTNGQPVVPATPPGFRTQNPDRNVSTLYGYDALGRQTLVTQTGILTGTLNVAASPPSFDAATTRATYTQYDGLDRPMTTTLNYRPDVTAPLSDTNLQTVQRYDAAGNPSWARDTLGRWTWTQYDPLNRPVTTTVNYEDGNPLSVSPQNQGWTDGSDSDLVGVTRYTADGSISATVANVVTGTDGQPLPFSASQPITNRVTQYQYDALGRSVTTTVNLDPHTPNSLNGLNRATVTRYDAAGRAMDTRDPLGHDTHQAYDALGRVAAVTLNYAATGPISADTNVVTRTLYDAFGRVSDVIGPLGQDTRTSYDGLGRPITATQDYTTTSGASGPDVNVATGTGYDALGQTVAVTDADGTATTYGYDALGQTVAVTDPVPDGSGNARVTRPAGGALGGASWSQGPDGRLVVRQADGLGRVIATTQNYTTTTGLPGNDTNLTTGVVYDPAGRAVQTSDAAGRVVATTYDQLDHIRARVQNYVPAGQPCVTAPCDATTQYGYDRAGDRTSVTDPRGVTTWSYGYDAASEQTTATDALRRTTRQDYNALGQVTTRHDPRGAASDVTYSYDGLGRPVGLASPGLAAPIAAGYDALGRRTSLSDASGTAAFGYDNVGRMTSAQAPGTGTVGYGYDAAGRRTGLAYPGANGTAGTQLAYSYDGDGRLTSVITAGATLPAVPLAAYEYDAAGRVASLQRANGATTAYGYDRADRLLDARTTLATGVQQSRYTRAVDVLGQQTALTETVRLTDPYGPGTATALGASTRTTTSARQGTSTGGAGVQSAAAMATAGGSLSARLAGAATGRANTSTISTGRAAPSGSTGTAGFQPAAASTGGTVSTGSAGVPPASSAASALGWAGALRLPLAFEPNAGQSAPPVRYLARGPGYTLFLTPREAVLTLAPPRCGGGPATKGAWQTTATKGAAPRARSRAHAGTRARSCDTTGRDATRVVRLRLLGTARAPRVAGLDRQAGRVRYVRGHAGRPGALSTPTYARVALRRVYRGIDLLYYGHAGQLEYDWLLAPHADARAIRLAVSGGGRLRLARDGALVLGDGPAALRQAPPAAYQVIHGQRHRVTARWVLRTGGQAGFRLGRYDHRRPLVIDPVLSYSSYLGGSANDLATTVAVDRQGNTYLTGYTNSPDFPRTSAVTTTAGSYDAFVTKIGPTGRISYSVYLGGRGSEQASGIAVDSQGNAYVTGETDSPDYPTTVSTVQVSSITVTAGVTTTVTNPVTVTTPATGTDAFVTKLGPSGAISYSVRLGSLGGVTALGDTWGRAIAVAPEGQGSGSVDAYVTGQTDSADFPVTTLAPVSATNGLTTTAHGTCTAASPGGQVGGPCYDAFVTRLTADGSGLIYSAYLGGGRDDYGYGIAADTTGNAYVTGRTESADFPVSGTLQTFNRGGNGACAESACPDAFVAKLNTMAGLTATTGLGALPLGGTALWTLTGAPGSAPSAAGPPSLLWSTYLGGGGADEGTGLGLDRAGNAYIVGDTAALSGTTTDDYPMTTGAYSTTYKSGGCPGGPCPDLFVTAVISDGSRLGYSSRFGGSGADWGRAIAVDSTGHAYLTGQTYSADYPTIGSLQGFSGTGAITTGVAFAARLTKKGDGLLYSSYLGGSGGDTGTGVAVDTVGDVALTGQTGSPDLLTTTNALSPTFAGGQDAFVAGIDNSTRVLTYGYDGLQRLSGVSETLGDAYSYGYDLAGNRTSLSVNGSTTLYGYDAASQVTGTVDALGRTTPYSYDAAGNLTSDGTSQYTYDALNRLTTLSAPSLQQTEAYTYTGDGLLVAQQANAVTTRYTQDLAAPLPQVLQTTRGSATPTDYLYGQPAGPAGDAERLASKSSGGSAHTWYVNDLQGSVRYTQDDTGSSGHSLDYDPAPLQYDPYGVPGTRDGGRLPNVFGYRGALHDSATGLVYLRARMYNPALGQFLSRDPLEQQTGQAYTYAGDNPTTNADPSGLCAIPTAGGGHQRLVGVGPADGPCSAQDEQRLVVTILSGQGTNPTGPLLTTAQFRCLEAQVLRLRHNRPAANFRYTSGFVAPGGVAGARTGLAIAADGAIDYGAILGGAEVAAEGTAIVSGAVAAAPVILGVAAVVAVGGLIYWLALNAAPPVMTPNDPCGNPPGDPFPVTCDPTDRTVPPPPAPRAKQLPLPLPEPDGNPDAPWLDPVPVPPLQTQPRLQPKDVEKARELQRRDRNKEGRPIVIFVQSTGRFPNITQNIYDAIVHGIDKTPSTNPRDPYRNAGVVIRPNVLHYRDNDRWGDDLTVKAKAGCPESNSGKQNPFRNNAPNNSCDEYPFAKTYEGGASGQLSARQGVPKSENDSQGGKLRGFYAAEQIRDTGDGRSNSFGHCDAGTYGVIAILANGSISGQPIENGAPGCKFVVRRSADPSILK